MQQGAHVATNDPILDELIREGLDDPETVGLLLSGSRAAVMATATSDYDVYWVLADEVYDRRRAPGVPLRARREPPDQPPVDLVYVCQRDLDGCRPCQAGGPTATRQRGCCSTRPAHC